MSLDIPRASATDPDADVSELEAEIDVRLEFLYFHQHEATTYDAWLAKKESERDTVIEEVRNFVAAGESGRTMNYSPNLINVVFVEVDGKPTKGEKVLLDGKLYVRNLTTTTELDPTTMAYLANVETDEETNP